MSTQIAKRPRLLIAAQSSPSVEAILTRTKRETLDVTVTPTPEFAVALCVGNEFSAIVLDAALIRNDDWTVAKSLKLIKPSVPIVLLDHRNIARRDRLPPDIDTIAKRDDPTEVLHRIKHLLVDRFQIDDDSLGVGT